MKQFIAPLQRKVCLGMVSALAVAAWADNSRVTALSYIHNGLIAQWDGIDNAGTGTHNASATVWTDLIGGRKFELHNTAWQNGQKLKFNGSSSYAFLNGTDTNATFGKTASKGVFEIALWIPNATYKTVLKSTANIAYNIQPGAYYCAFRNSSTHTHNVGVNQTATVAVVYKSGTVSDFVVYKNGGTQIANTGKTDNVGGNATGGTILGCRSTASSFNGERWWGGDIKSIRLYNRTLSVEELQINYAIDRVRFYGVTSDINTILPAGWGVGDDHELCHLYTGACTLTTGTSYGDYNVEFAADANMTFSSVPNAGTAALTVTGKKATVKGNVTFTLPRSVLPGTYTLVQAQSVVAEGATVTVVDPSGGCVCTPTVTENAITVTVAYRDPSLPVTARWLGGATDSYAESANWFCTDANGVTVEGIPNNQTTVELPDGCVFNLPANASFVCKWVRFPATLGGDCDWRGLKDIPLHSTINLDGHKLYLAQLVGAGTLTSASGGEVHVDVPSGKTTENTTLTLAGALKLVKDGAGTFVAHKKNQTYSGGTRVTGGLFALWNSAANATDWSPKSAQTMGALGSTIDVDSGARFNIVGNYDFNQMTFRLNGGRLESNNRPLQDVSGGSAFAQSQMTWGGLGNITLTADSKYLVRYEIIQNQGVVSLNGHTLDIEFTNGKNLHWSSGIKDGTIIARNSDTSASGASWFKTIAAVDARTITFDLYEQFNLANAFSVSNYVSHSRNDLTTGHSGTAALNVYGTFSPITDFFYGCTMQNGSTIDLSSKTAVWSTTSRSKTGKTTVDFANDATITVKAPAFKLTNDALVIAWAAKPANADTLKFVLQPNAVNPSGRLYMSDDGVRFRYNTFVVLLR